ncbi:MAG TPA: pyrroloquinoline-quinone synthase PqqC [Chthoniobacterales bacterium]
MIDDEKSWDREAFEARLRAVGPLSYHSKHPFHEAMNDGQLAPEAIRGWVINRFQYQRSIPLKDAAIISNCPLKEVRQSWIRRVVDHDGSGPNEGGIEAWLRLGEACGLTRERLLAGQDVLPGVRFAVEAYVTFARTQPWPITVASSLTELFAPDLMAERLHAFRRYYTWVKPEGLDYFERRLTQARRDSEEGLRLTLEHCRTRTMQEAAVGAIAFKCDVLWAMLDAILWRYAPEVSRRVT